MTKEKLLFDSFNARYMSYEEVVYSFIPNDHYSELIKNNHTLLMGPRGSGKTTLLKMLTPSAQYHWQKKNKSGDSLPFTGIYIASDIQWKRQIEQLESDFQSEPDFASRISNHLVTINVLISLVNTFEEVIELNSEMSEDLITVESKICSELISEWSIEKPISPNFSSIIQSLLKRLKDINARVRFAKNRPKRNDDDLPSYFNEDYFDLVRIGCHIFKKHTAKILPHLPFRWALCFDELEISPKWLQMQLLDKMRSTSQEFILKLTTVPIISLLDRAKKQQYSIEAQENEDYRVIRTWAFDEGESNALLEFCEKLFIEKLKNKFNSSFRIEDIFGSDSLDRNLKSTFSNRGLEESRADAYEKGTILWQLFKEYALIDSSFRQFLISQDINPLNPVPVKENQKDAIFRKIKPIVTYRFQYRTTTGLRSRRNPDLFYGIPYIYKICDGNPRLLIGLIDEFISKMSLDENSKIKRLSISKQSATIQAFSELHLHLIETNPEANLEHFGRHLQLGKILKFIGDYFSSRFLSKDFEMDPVNCFVVDKNVDEKIVILLEVALHLGAIIYVNPKQSVAADGIVGKKFRLSYLLYPHFKLPRIQYKSINLSKILHSKEYSSLNQSSLFNE